MDLCKKNNKQTTKNEKGVWKGAKALGKPRGSKVSKSVRPTAPKKRGVDDKEKDSQAGLASPSRGEVADERDKVVCQVREFLELRRDKRKEPRVEKVDLFATGPNQAC